MHRLSDPRQPGRANARSARGNAESGEKRGKDAKWPAEIATIQKKRRFNGLAGTGRSVGN
jgi:hypothetical protein